MKNLGSKGRRPAPKEAGIQPGAAVPLIAQSDGLARTSVRAAYLERSRVACLAILAAGTIAAYSNTFAVPIMQDDRPAILDNASVHALWPVWRALSPPAGAPEAGRPLLNFSYALNYAAGGTAVFGYHLVNLAVHLFACWALFGLVRRTLLCPTLAGRFGPFASRLALATSAVWAWHPVLTESVTYISQRAESMMGLFYLLTVYCFARGSGSGSGMRRGAWFSLSVLASLAGAATKEVIVTAPLMVLLYDRTFASGQFRAAWRGHWPLYLALAASWIPIAIHAAGLREVGVGYASGIGWWAYALAECRAVVKYVCLAAWPNPLVFDYGWYEPSRLSQVWPYALVLAALLTATLFSLRRLPAAGFAACWFFLILAPTSSIVPVAGQSIAENRMYLPLAGLAALAVLGAFTVAGRRGLLAAGAAALCLGLSTARRNQAYQSELVLLSDTLERVPDNARAHNNLGLTLDKIPGRSTEAVAQFLEAVRLRPGYADAYFNLGNTLAKDPGRLGDAAAQYEKALRIKPDFADAHTNLGNALLGTPGRLGDAVAQFEEALRLRPDLPEAHNDLGNALFQMPGRLGDAAAQYEEALRLRPDFAEAHHNLANALMRMPGRLADAVAQYEYALRLRPDDFETHEDFAYALEKLPGRLGDAVAQYEETLRLEPDSAVAHNNLANVLQGIPGRLNDAIGQYEAALSLEPNSADILVNLGTALGAAGRLPEAILRFEEALRLRPDFAAAHYKLAVALLRGPPVRRDEAEAHLEAVLRIEPGDAAAARLLGAVRKAQAQPTPAGAK